MKPPYDTTLPPVGPTPSDIGRWPVSLFDIHARLAPRFARAEPRRRALRYLQAVISDIPRKNGWQIAEHAKERRPYGMQRLLSRAVWDHEGVRDDLRTVLSQALSPPALPSQPPASSAPFPVLVIDESGFPKRGQHSAGVQAQYCGSTGRVENCQVGVFLADKWSLENSHLSGYYVALTLASSIVFKDNEGQFHIISYVTQRGHGLIDRELYLPEDWCHDPARRLAAHIPQRATFQTKPN